MDINQLWVSAQGLEKNLEPLRVWSERFPYSMLLCSILLDISPGVKVDPTFADRLDLTWNYILHVNEDPKVYFSNSINSAFFSGF